MMTGVDHIFDPSELMAHRLPGANLDVGLEFLGGDPEGPYWMAVVFPPGFRRPGSPAVDTAEGYFVLEGELHFSGVVSPSGSYTLIPPGAARVDTGTEVPTTAVARFGRRPNWLESGNPEAGPISVTEPDGPVRPTPLGHGWELASHDGVRVLMVESLTTGPSPVGAYVVSLADGTAVSVAEGEIPPQLSGPIGAWVPS